MDSKPIAVLGAGSWGTALAIQLARAGRPVLLWGRGAAHLAACATARRNERYLPEAAFPPTLQVEPDLARAVAAARDLLVVVPSHAFRSLLLEINGLVGADSLPSVGSELPATMNASPVGGSLLPTGVTSHRLAWATKGFEVATGLLPHQVAHEVLGPGMPLAVLSGPTFAREVGAGLPTAMTVASNDKSFADDLALALSSHHFRAYTSPDLIGVEVGGAVKNALAIGTGIADGLGFGANTRIALITRGLAEMSRLGVKLGAQPATFMGLAALGDLVLTCTDNQSRNRRFGLLLAAGKNMDEAAADIGQVVEGVKAAKAVHDVAAREGIDMPIINAVHGILHEGLPVADAVKRLLGRELKPELQT
jgi:glycerol-3-phosphate dehydrogenase (NAD(P)+)